MALSPVNQAFMSGQVSPKAAKKLRLQTGGKKMPSKMADFNDTSGRADQGGGKQRGVVKARHLNQARHQSTGSPARASGLPSKGGQAPTGRPKMDGASKFPPGARASGKMGNGPKLSAQAGPIAPTGGWYGDDADDYRTTQ